MAVDVGIVIGNSAVPTTGDQDLYDRVIDLGFAPVFVDDGAAVPGGMDGFVIADSVTPATVGTKYDALALPVLTLEFGLWDVNHLAANQGAATAASAALDLDAHTITTGFADPLTVLASAQAQRGVLLADLGVGAVKFARPGLDATRAEGWTYETGAALSGGGAAPARRAAYHLPEAWLGLFTVSGVDLLEAILNWCFRPFSVTFDAVLSRVRLSTDGYGLATSAVVERSLDQVTWTPVRGGNPAPVSAGAVALDDYEFTPGVPNYYRVTADRDVRFTGTTSGVAATANNASVSPALPVAARAKHLLLTAAGIRATTATVGTPAGWGAVMDAGHVKLMARQHSGTEVAPTVTVAGGAAGDDVIGQTFSCRCATTTASAVASQLNASAQNIAYPALAVSVPRQFVTVLGFRQDDWTSVATLPGVGVAEVGEPVATAGNDAGLVWDVYQQTGNDPADVAAGQFVVTGGAAAISRGAVVALVPDTFRYTASVTPVQTGVWLKNLTRPYLNRAVTVTGFSDIVQPARMGLLDVVGRSFPVAITDKRAGRRFNLTLMVPDLAAAEDLRLVLSEGSPVYLQSPGSAASCPIPTLYAAVGDVTIRRSSQRGVRRFFTLPLTEVAAPEADLVGSTLTYATVAASYASYAALAAVEVTYSDLAEGIGSAGEVIVP